MAELKTATTSAVNTYETSYNDMINYLKAQGVIESTENPVDINTTGGYYNNNVTHAIDTEKVNACADKAYDYNGVYVFWWDLENTKYGSYYANAKNANAIQINGGQYTLSVQSVSGAYAIAFKTVSQSQYDNWYDWTGTEKYEDYQTRYNTAVANAKAENGISDKIAKFEAIDNTAVSLKDYTSADELALAFKNAGLIKMTDISAKVNMNESVVYNTTTAKWVGYYNADTNPNGTETGYSEETPTTAYAKYATEAYTYGKVSILYFNNLSGLSKPVSTVYDALKTDKTSFLYEKITRTADWTEIANSQFTVTLLEGNFAVIVTE